MVYRTRILCCLCTLLSGCYLSHGASDVDEPDAGPRRVDAGAPGDGGGGPDAGADAGDDRCRGTWQVTRTRQLTDAPPEEVVDDLAWTGGEYLVVYRAPFPDRNRYAMPVRFGAETPAHRVFGAPPGAGWFAAVDVAVAGSAVALVSSESRGCFFRRVAADGAPLGPPREVDIRECRELVPSGDGFSMIGHERLDVGLNFFELSTDGELRGGPVPADTFGDYYSQHARVRLDDDSQLLVVVREDDAGAFRAIVDHLDARGGVLGPRQTLDAIDESTPLRSVPTPTGSLIAWLAATGEPVRRDIRLLPTDRDGRAAREPMTPPEVRMGWSTAWSLVRLRGEVLLFYIELSTEDPLPAETAIRAQRLDDLGAPVGSPFTVVPNVTAGPQLVARTNGVDVMLVYNDGEPDARELFAAQLECR